MLQRNNSKSRAALGPGHWESKYIKPRGFFFIIIFFISLMKLNYSLIITLISWYFLPSLGLCCQVILYDAEAECTCSPRSKSGPKMLAITSAVIP